MPLKEERRGGEREGSGRKPIAPGVKRVTFSASVAPDTLAVLRREAKRRNVSPGVLLDELVGALGNKKPPLK